MLSLRAAETLDDERDDLAQGLYTRIWRGVCDGVRLIIILAPLLCTFIAAASLACSALLN
jgi:hypothetical protein